MSRSLHSIRRNGHLSVDNIPHHDQLGVYFYRYFDVALELFVQAIRTLTGDFFVRVFRLKGAIVTYRLCQLDLHLGSAPRTLISKLTHGRLKPPIYIFTARCSTGSLEWSLARRITVSSSPGNACQSLERTRVDCVFVLVRFQGLFFNLILSRMCEPPPGRSGRCPAPTCIFCCSGPSSGSWRDVILWFVASLFVRAFVLVLDSLSVLLSSFSFAGIPDYH